MTPYVYFLVVLFSRALRLCRVEPGRCRGGEVDGSSSGGRLPELGGGKAGDMSKDRGRDREDQGKTRKERGTGCRL